MSFTVTVSKQAEEDIRGLYEYIAYTLRSKQNAVGQISRLEKEILSLGLRLKAGILHLLESALHLLNGSVKDALLCLELCPKIRSFSES